MNKMAAIQGQRARVDRIILENLDQYSAIRTAIAGMAERPEDPATAEAVDATFRRLSQGLEELGNSLTTFANIIVSEDGVVDEIDGREEENGIRLL